MFSALSVLALLLLSADGTQDPKASSAAPVEVTALAVDVDFVCRTRTTQSLVLTPMAQGQVTVPEDCPDAGATWRLTVDCTNDARCSGYVRATAGAIALVQGTRKQLAVKPIAQEHPPTLKVMALSVTGQHTVRMKTPEHLQQPVQLRFQAHKVGAMYTVKPAEMVSLKLSPGPTRLELTAQVSRLDFEHVHLKLWNARSGLLVDETLTLGAERSLDCQRLENICEGVMKLQVLEYQRF